MEDYYFKCEECGKGESVPEQYVDENNLCEQCKKSKKNNDSTKS